MEAFVIVSVARTRKEEPRLVVLDECVNFLDGEVVDEEVTMNT